MDQFVHYREVNNCPIALLGASESVLYTEVSEVLMCVHM